MRHEEYAKFDAVGLAQLVERGEVSPAEVLAAAEARIDAVNPKINAVVHRIQPAAAAAGDGPLSGVPFLLKDMDGMLAGEPCSYGSRSLFTWRPERDSELVARYRQAGLRIIGKTNCPEFGIMGITEPELFGPARNPWNLEHTPGGSSGGSAAAVAAGIVPMASAGDGGGSIRIPASACGLFGLKPSRGLMPLGPEGDPWLGLVTRHVITRSVRDSAAVLDLTAGNDPGALYAAPARPRSYLSGLSRAPKRLTIGVSRESFLGAPLHPDNAAAVGSAAALLEQLGHRVVELDLPIDYRAVAQAYLTIVAAGVATDVRATADKTGREPKPENFEQPTWFLKQVGEGLSAADLYAAHEVAASSARRLAQMYESVDLHLSATMAAPPVKVGELSVGRVESIALSTFARLPTPSFVLRQAFEQMAEDSLVKTPNTQVYNLTGHPAMNLPLYRNSSKLPIGVQVAGPIGSELLLLRLAQQVHNARPWADTLPSLDR